MQDPSVRGLAADLTPENCTIAHIAALLGRRELGLKKRFFLFFNQ